MMRYCAVDDFTLDVLRDGGEWSEAEVFGNRAIVRVRAGPATLARIARGSDIPIQRIDDPELLRTTLRAKPVGHGGEIAFDSGAFQRCRTLAELLDDVLDDAQQDDVLRAVESLAQQADRQGHVCLRGAPWPRAVKLLALLGRMGYGLDRVSTGTFPTTGLLDNFNRANQGPPPSASWSTDIWGESAGGLRVVSNQCADEAGDGGDGWWNAATHGPNSEAYCDLSTADLWLEVYARLISPGTAGLDGYFLQILPAAGDEDARIFRIDNAIETQLGATYTAGTYGSGNQIGFELIGGTLTAYQNTGSWTPLFSRSDSAYGSAGYIGLSQGRGTARFDNLGGGTVVPTASVMAKMMLAQHGGD